MKNGAITEALIVLSEGTYAATIEERRQQYAGPYRAMSAYKGDEEKGERDWPWIVVGAAGVNCFGRLWPRDYAVALADKMNTND